MKILALIPARGGSKGVPRKNLKPLCGKPLIAYSIQCALDSKKINRVIVSTDDTEIAEVAKKYGAEVPFLRPSELAQDQSIDHEVFLHALNYLKSQEYYSPDVVVHLRPTCPTRNVELIDKAIELFLSNPKADSLRSINIPKYTPYKMWRIDGDTLQPLLKLPEFPEFKEPYNMPRQLLPAVYWQNGYVDITKPRTVLDLGMMCGFYILPFLIKEPFAELDYEESFIEAEKILLAQEQGLNLTLENRHSS